MERTDDQGRWVSDDEVTWLLVEPSAAFVASQVPDPAYLPLDAAGALATLLVVVGILDLGDASAAVGREPNHLIHEAQAWSLG